MVRFSGCLKVSFEVNMSIMLFSNPSDTLINPKQKLHEGICFPFTYEGKDEFGRQMSSIESPLSQFSICSPLHA